MIGKTFFIKYEQLKAVLDRIGVLRKKYKAPRARLQTNEPSVIFEIEHLEGDISRIDSLMRNCQNGKLAIEVTSKTNAQNIQQYNHRLGRNGTFILVVENPKPNAINFFPYF